MKRVVTRSFRPARCGAPRDWLGVCVLLGLGCSGRLDVGAGAGGQGGLGFGGAGAGYTSAGNASAGYGTTPGAACIPGATTREGVGTPSEAEIRTPDRCAEGLRCEAGLCAVMPSCADNSAADCIVRRAEGSGGTSGTGPLGSGGATPGETLNHNQITSLAADATNLYWLDYGTRDTLGNHQHDGALIAYSLDDGTTTTLSTGLPGPVALGITDSYAYIGVDGASLVGSPAKTQILRVALSGGTTEIVQADGALGPSNPIGTVAFGSSGGDAFWSNDGGIYSFPADATGPIKLGEFKASTSVASDGQSLFFAEVTDSLFVNTVVKRAALSDLVPSPLAAPAYPFTLHDGYLYGQDTFLVRVSVSGGSWERVRPLGVHHAARDLQIQGERFFVHQTFEDDEVLTGRLDSDDPPVRVLVRPLEQFSEPWLATPQRLFWTNGSTIYSRPIE